MTELREAIEVLRDLRSHQNAYSPEEKALDLAIDVLIDELTREEAGTTDGTPDHVHD